MSLDYDLSKITNRGTSDEEWETTQSIIFGCMITDLGEITEANHEEWFARFKMIMPQSKITLQNVHDHIGLRTNVTNRTRLQWLKGTVSNNVDRMIADQRWAKHQRARELAATEALLKPHMASCATHTGNPCDCP